MLRRCTARLCDATAKPGRAQRRRGSVLFRNGKVEWCAVVLGQGDVMHGSGRAASRTAREKRGKALVLPIQADRRCSEVSRIVKVKFCPVLRW